MTQINPTLPTPGPGASDGIWGAQLNAALQALLAQGNASDTALGNRAPRALARSVFGPRANGSFTVQDTGQTVAPTGSSPLSIVSGVLTHTNVGAGSAGYAETNLGVRVGRLGATFQIPDATKSGTLTFVVPQASWVSGGVGSSPAACHFTLTATAWAYQIFDGTSLNTITSGSLALASNTDYDLEITLDGPTARVVLPDGTVVTVTNAQINSFTGSLAILELFNIDAAAVPQKVSSMRLDGVQLAPFTASTSARMTGAAFAALALKAPLASPVFTGDPQAPTPATSDNDTSIATTAFVKAQGYLTTAPTASDATTTSKGIVQLAGDLAGTAAAPTVPGLAAKAPLASPAFTGTPTTPTPANGTNSLQVANAAMVTIAQSSLVGVNPQTVAYTLIFSDAGKLITVNATAAVTLTVPQNANVGYPIGTVIPLANLSTFALTIAGASGVTVSSPAGNRITTQYGQATLTKIGTDSWLLSGMTVV